MTAELSITLNPARFRLKLKAALNGLDRASLRSAALSASILAESIERVSRRDTNRYRRAWVEANNQIAARANSPDLRVRMPPLKKPKLYPKYLEILKQQAATARKAGRIAWQLLDAWYYRNGREEDKFARALKRRAEFYNRREFAAERELARAEANPSVIFFGALSFREGKSATFDPADPNAKRLATVRHTIPGGKGLLVKLRDGATATLVNQEPHALVVERRFKTLQKALLISRRLGVSKVSAVYKTHSAMFLPGPPNLLK